MAGSRFRFTRLLWYPIALLCCCASGQEPNQKSKEPPSFTIGANVNRVLAPVVVRDKQGRVVEDLKQEDFQVFDDGKPHPLSSFLIEKRGTTQGDTIHGNPPQAPISASRQVSAQGRRFLIFLFDDMHLSMEDLVHAQKSAAKMLTDMMADSDLAAIVSISGKVNSGLTQDHAKLQNAILNLRPLNLLRSDGAECPNIDYYQADQIEHLHNDVALQAAIQQVFSCTPGLNPQRDRDMAERIAESSATRAVNLGLHDTQESFAALGGFVRAMANMPGQRTLILVSPGFLSIAPESRTAESRLLDLAAQSNVTINALDARGLYTTELDASERSQGNARTMQLKAEYHRSSATQTENIMAELADGTGGRYFHNSNDLDAGFKSLAEAPECIYLLELSLGDVKQNGSYHRLKVKVDRDGLNLQVRHGYFAPKPEKKK